MARYAWFALPPYKALGLADGSSGGALTPVGRAYAAAGAASPPPATPTPTPSPPAGTSPPVSPPVTPAPTTPAPTTPAPTTPAPTTPAPTSPPPGTTAAPGGPPPSTTPAPTTQSPAAAAHAKKVRPVTPPACMSQHTRRCIPMSRRLGRSNAGQKTTFYRADFDRGFLKIHGMSESVQAELNVHAAAITLTFAAGRGQLVLQWAGHSSERCECDVGV